MNITKYAKISVITIGLNEDDEGNLDQQVWETHDSFTVVLNESKPIEEQLITAIREYADKNYIELDEKPEFIENSLFAYGKYPQECVAESVTFYVS